jgi:hypothetical protein
MRRDPTAKAMEIEGRARPVPAGEDARRSTRLTPAGTCSSAGFRASADPRLHSLDRLPI